jgi:hypothetical protein
LFGQLILEAEFSAAALALGRIGGAAMFALGPAASWPSGVTVVPATPATRALLIYNVLATLHLGYLGGVAKIEGVPLWPPAAVHAVLLAIRWFASAKRSRVDKVVAA